MATGKLIGADSGDSGSNIHAANYIIFTRFQAEATGTVSEIKVKAQDPGNVKVAIYADSSGEPGSLLNSTGSAAVVAGWNTFALTPTSVTSGTYYWLAVMLDTTGAAMYNNTSGVMRYKSLAFASAWPNPAGSGYSSGSFHGLLAGWGVLIISPSGLSQPLAYGTPKLILTIKPPGYQQPIAYGTPAVSVAGLVISPPGLEVVVAYGAPSLLYPQTISPPGLDVVIAYGTPSVGIVGVISVPGHDQIIEYGTPTLLKYVWHVILDGRYLTESPETNRSFVIGRDQYGNPVWGEAQDSTEIALVGERLDFQQELAIPTTAQAEDVAEAILSKMRLTEKRGVILIPPNCGQELFDVVQITDAGANQSAVKFRVVGFRFEYNPRHARYHHKLILGAP